MPRLCKNILRLSPVANRSVPAALHPVALVFVAVLEDLLERRAALVHLPDTYLIVHSLAKLNINPQFDQRGFKKLKRNGNESIWPYRVQDVLVDAVHDERHGAHHRRAEDRRVALVALAHLGRHVRHGVGRGVAHLKKDKEMPTTDLHFDHIHRSPSSS